MLTLRERIVRRPLPYAAGRGAEDYDSLETKKMETVMAKNVAGIAFWKLGFERMATWTTIEKYVK